MEEEINEEELRGYYFILEPTIDPNTMEAETLVGGLIEIPELYLQGEEVINAFINLYEDNTQEKKDAESLAATLKAMDMRLRFSNNGTGPYLIKTRFKMSAEDIESYIKSLRKQGGTALKDFLDSAKV